MSEKTHAIALPNKTHVKTLITLSASTQDAEKTVDKTSRVLADETFQGEVERQQTARAIHTQHHTQQPRHQHHLVPAQHIAQAGNQKKIVHTCWEGRVEGKRIKDGWIVEFLHAMHACMMHA